MVELSISRDIVSFVKLILYDDNFSHIGRDIKTLLMTSLIVFIVLKNSFHMV